MKWRDYDFVRKADGHTIHIRATSWKDAEWRLVNRRHMSLADWDRA